MSGLECNFFTQLEKEICDIYLEFDYPGFVVGGMDPELIKRSQELMREMRHIVIDEIRKRTGEQ